MSQDLSDIFAPFVVAAEATRMPMLFTDARAVSKNVVFVNESFLSLVGRPQDEILGQPIDNLLLETIEQESFGELKDALSEGLKGEWRLPCRTGDGSHFWASILASPVRDHKGALTHNFLSFVRLDGSNEAFAARPEALSALYEETPGFIAITEGHEHLITFANAACKRFVNKEDLVGRSITEAIPNLTEQGIVALLDNVFQSGVAYTGTDVIMTFIGNDDRPVIRYCDFIAQPIRSIDGSITGLFCEGYDTTDRHDAMTAVPILQSEVIQLSRLNAMGTMAATLAHELNQPLTAINNYAEAAAMQLTRDNDSGKSEALEALREIIKLSKRTGALIKNLRDMTQNKLVERDEIDLGQAVAECILLVKATAHRPANFSNPTSCKLRAFGDAIQVNQVLINLLTNALEAVPASRIPAVKVSCELRNDAVVVIIEDNGSGIASEAVDTLFTFAQTSKPSGMGIGLSVCQTIIEAHGGRLWLEKTNSEGSTFCFTLPCEKSGSP